MSYGNTIFAGDLHHKSSERYLPNVALAINLTKNLIHHKAIKSQS